MPSFDEALDQVLSAATTEQRLDALATLVEVLHGIPAESRAPASDDHFHTPGHVPPPLLWLHSNYAGFPNVHSRQNQLVPLSRFERGPRSEFLIENQGVYLWATAAEDPPLAKADSPDAPTLFRVSEPTRFSSSTRRMVDRADPPVWGRLNERGARWRRHSESLSTFLVQHVLIEFTFSSKGSVSSTSAPRKAVDRATASLRQIFSPWHWPKYPNRIWAGDSGVVLSECPNGPRGAADDAWQVTAAATDPELLTPFWNALPDGDRFGRLGPE